MILVTGATGNVGGELVRILAESGHPVRALVRGEPRSKFPPNVDLGVGDLSRPASLVDALHGARAVFLLGGYPDMPGVLAQIRRAGVERVVLLSSRSAVIGGDGSNAIVRMWHVAEAAVRSAGLSWTMLQPSGFMSNALRWRAQIQAGNVIRIPFAHVPIAAIDPADIAAVAAIALTSAGHDYRTHMLTGPAAIRPDEQIRILSRVLGRELRAEEQPEAEARAQMRPSTPPAFIDAFFRFFAAGEFNDASVLSTVREITGQAPRTFEQWAHAHAAVFDIGKNAS